MAKSSATPSAADAKDAAGTGPSPYGTRSRNRTGRARPNYAEDKDFDMDFENYPDKKDEADPKKPTKQANVPTQPSEAPRTATPSTRKPLPNGDGAKQAAAAKDQPQPSGQAGAPAPSSSTVATGSSSSSNTTAAATSTTTTQTSKKRKAGTQNGVGNANQPQNSAAHTPAPSASNPKKSSGSALPGYAESNMLSFDNCKGRPLNGTLVADDGTTLAVNGKPSLDTCMYPCDLNHPLTDAPSQIMSISFVSHRASHTTLAGLWSFCTPKMTRPSTLTRFGSIGSTGPRILRASRKTRACCSRQCIRTSVR